MDYRCPACRQDAGKRRLAEAVITRMEVTCPRCGSLMALNVHRAEGALVVAVFAAIVVLGTLGFRLQSHGLMLATFAVAMAGAAALPLLENVWLRSWPRYAAPPPRPRP